MYVQTLRYMDYVLDGKSNRQRYRYTPTEPPHPAYCPAKHDTSAHHLQKLAHPSSSLLRCC